MSYHGEMADAATRDLIVVEHSMIRREFERIRNADPLELSRLLHAVAGNVAYSIIRGSPWTIEAEVGIQAAINDALGDVGALDKFLADRGQT